ncbi:glycosyltransferase, partial [Candidatus Venteria ishoeyi]
METLITQSADQVFTLNRFMKEELIRRGVKEEKIELVPNGYSGELPDLDRSSKLSRADIGCKTQYVVGYVGSFSLYEGLDELLKACAQVRQQGIDVSLLLVGSSNSQGLLETNEPCIITEELMQLAKTLDFEDYLHLPGRIPQDELGDYYALINLVVIPRKSLPVCELVSPIKPLEVLAYGKPLLVSDVKPLKEFADSTSGVFTFRYGYDLVEKLTTLLLDSSLHDKNSGDIQAIVSKNFLFSEIIKPIYSVISNLNLNKKDIKYDDIDRKHVENSEKLKDFIMLVEQQPIILLYGELSLNIVDGSSIWLSSMYNICISSANVILLVKQNIKNNLITSNFIQTEYNGLILEPNDINFNNNLSPQNASNVLIKLDKILPNIKLLIVRGVDVCKEISKTERFKYRLVPYLTNLYKPTVNGPQFDKVSKKDLELISNQVKLWLWQTNEMKDWVKKNTSITLDNSILFPPVLPEILAPKQKKITKNEVMIAYSGKIQPDWGVIDLIEHVKKLRDKNINIKLRIISGKISYGSNFKSGEGFVERVNDLLKLDFIEYIKDVNRESSLQLLGDADYIWCYRPSYFEKNTLELSTKLLEALSLGKPTICYPNKINQELLGIKYPYFIKEPENLLNIINLKREDKFLQGIASFVQEKYGIKNRKNSFKNIFFSKKEMKKIKVALICDEFTFNSFKYEFDAIIIEPHNWKEVFEKKQPDLFFCESAWAGIDPVKRPWKGKVYSSIRFEKENRGVLLDILNYCKQHSIKTMFWNKEDPTHFTDRVHDFVKTAALFDYVFTTAIECIENYKQQYNCKNVFYLPFATQPKLFNPIENYTRSKKVIFAGSWYEQHENRCRDMRMLFDNIFNSNYDLEIYDRCYGDNNPNHLYPNEYNKFVKPKVAFNKIDKVYKSSIFGLNINTVKNSKTMFARRVFELMSSNTLVITNYAKGIEHFFKNQVID